MQFEEFDIKIKQAAEHHHPSYDEQAWTKMERLLNKHLPRKEDNRRRYLFFFLLFLGLGIAGLLISKNWKGTNSTAITQQTIQKEQAVIAEPGNKNPTSEVAKINASTDNKESERKFAATDSSSMEAVEKRNATITLLQEPIDLTNITNKENSITNQPGLAPGNPLGNHSNVRKIQPVAKIDKNRWQKKQQSKEPVGVVTTEISHPVISSSIGNTNNKSITVAWPPQVNTAVSVVEEPVESAASQKDAQPVAQQTKKKEKNKRKKVTGFFFSLSAGPDVSFVSDDKLGTTKLLVGAGLGYTFNSRLTIRSGFYSGRKVYSASPGTYDPPASFYTAYPYLEKVDADCKVYEIPVIVSYTFSRSSNQNFFASAGFSSLLMKKETYNYSYKYTPAGITYKRRQTINNQNKHFFSTLTLSAGYQRRIGPSISVMAEPYLKLPLNGVGYGKVKLNSAGVLFSVAIKPFGSN